ncbi:sterol desaturase family protein [Kordia algicida OT-1]|uniref:Arginine/ornithine transport system ATPase n=1 Tax=Kordia algicida OT-1 TaxID=391587 RepID=A9E018_9FLAO|nr:sterol desaturase family protein [Kordia algicida]EDP95788.1 arginine/ornithine transport system ATPase [Kordia algicida OT-1]
MEAYANALLYAIPFFSILVIVEIAYGYFVKNQTHNVNDTVSSISSGLTSIIKDSLGLAVILISYPFLVENLALFNVSETWYAYLLAFIAIDFASYWNHRLSHKINFFWNQHVIHHSSEEFNLACALRQSISNILGYFPLLLIPAALIGIPFKIIAILSPIHLFAQFWYHTKHIGKLGFLEYIIVTPSQHRVHHAINPEYIDKNLAAVFCVWDRIFGTFQEELDEVPPVFGVLKPAATWNPILINFQHLWRLIKDAWRTNSYYDKLRIWFMPTGWRPKDVSKKYPVTIIENVYQFEKYNTETSISLQIWSIIQMIITIFLMLFLFYNFGNILETGGFPMILLYGAIVFIGIYSYTSLLDTYKYTIVFELVKLTLGLFAILFFKDWFGLNSYFYYGNMVMGMYFVASFLATIYFSFVERKFVTSKAITI